MTGQDIIAAYQLGFVNGDTNVELIASVWDKDEPVAVAWGWREEAEPGRMVARVERVIVAPKKRGGFAAIKKLMAAWDDECRAHDLGVMTTRIDRGRYSVEKIGVRIGGYIKYAEDESYTYYYRVIPPAA